jgi:pantoate--beta-alanine ligase
VSIFVNPYQFAPTEDFDKYPRTFERDLALLTEAGVDCVFYPSEQEMYPHGRDGIVSVQPGSPLNDTLEGAFRPTFFRGVSTVVLKLFALVEPHIAYFGEKDFQQLLVIKALTRDLNLPLQIVGVPTVRESDGLAMSSRNAYLEADKRNLAPVLHKTLSAVKEGYGGGIKLAEALSQAKSKLSEVPQIELQYLSVCHAGTLMPLDEFALPFVVLVAAKLGSVRLIDNIVVRD